MRSALGLLKTLPALLLVVTGALVATPAASGAAPDDGGRERVARARVGSVTLEGRGYGHGAGLSQYGAQGRASELGQSYRQILAFYYPGTRLGRVGGKLRIQLSVDTTDDVVVLHRAGLRLRRVTDGRTWRLARSGAKRWRVTAAPGGRSRLAVKVKRRWRAVRTVRGEVEFVARGGALRLVTPSGVRPYQGALRSAVVGGRRDTVNVVAVEAYLRGVVPREVPALWHPQAVRAQAVAARTYALFERASRPRAAYHLCDTAACQVYGGLGDAHPATDRAIGATRGQTVMWEGKPAFTQFSASNGGWSTDGSYPYLRAQADPGDGYGVWRHNLSAAAIQRAYPGIGSFQGIDVVARDGNGAWGGRATSVRIRGSGRSTTVSGDTFRVVFGLRSTWFRTVAGR